MSAQIISLPTLSSSSGPARPVARRSLSDQDCFSIAAAMQVLPGGWQAQRDEQPDGEIVMSLFVHEEDEAPAFMVRRNGLRLRLLNTQAVIGDYGNVYELMSAARSALG